MIDKPNAKRLRWRRWGMAALLIYLWGWLAIWLLADFIDGRWLLARILSLVYWPLIKLAELSFWVRS